MLTFNRKELVRSLQAACKLIPAKEHNALLACVCVSPFSIQAFNDNTHLRLKCEPAFTDSQTDTFLVPAHALLKIVKGMASETVNLSETGSLIQIQGDFSSSLMLKENVNLENFPLEDCGALPLARIDLSPFQIQDVCDKVVPFTSNDTTRYALCNVMVKPTNQGYCFAGTDGHRLSKIDIEDPSEEKTVEFLISTQIMDVLGVLTKKTIDKVSFRPGENVLFVEGPSFTMRKKTDDLRIIDFQQVIPSSHETTILASTKTWQNALKGAKGFETVRLECGSAMKLECQDKAGGTFATEFPCESKGPNFVAGFCPKYLKEAVDCVEKSTFFMGFGDPNSPLTFVSGSWTHVIMPMRI